MKKLCRKIFCKKVDERENAEFMKIGNLSFWAMTMALTASILIQTVFYNPPIGQIIGELVSLIFGIAVLCVGCAMNGLWDGYTKPNLKTYTLASAVAGLISGGLTALKIYLANGSLTARGALSVTITFGATFVLTFLLLASIGAVTKARASRLEEKYKNDFQ